jgi:integrase
MLPTAAEEGVIPTNPTRGIRVPSPRMGDRAVRALDPAEVQALIQATPEGMSRCLVRVLGEGGLRISEALGLRWGDLDLGAEPPRLRVERRIVAGDLDVPKSSYGRRTVPLGRGLAAELRAWRLASAFSQDDDPVFASMRGRPHDPRQLRRPVLGPAAAAAGLEPLGFHTLRHTAATNLLRPGVRRWS